MGIKEPGFIINYTEFNKNEKIVERENLFSKLDDNNFKKLIIVSAPAGYGKTTLIESYLRARKKKFVWVKIQSNKYSFYTFIEQLLLCIKKSEHSFGGKINDLIINAKSSKEISGKENEVAYDFAGFFSAELGKFFSDDLYLVFDDLHNLSNIKTSGLQIFFDSLLQLLPSNIHLVITTRVENTVDFTILKAKRDSFEITAGDLEFSLDETCMLIKAFYPGSFDSNFAKDIHSILNGWITGIHLALQAGIKKSADTLLLKYRINENLYSFFLNEIWNTLAAELKKFLLKTALLDSFTEDLCINLFNIKDAPNYLNEIIKGNIFILKSYHKYNGEIIPYYTYNDTFKEFLLNKLSEFETKENIQSQIKEIALYFKSVKDYEKSILYYLKSSGFEEAAELLRILFSFNDDADTLQKLDYWLSLIPEKNVINNHYLLFLKARNKLYLNKDSIGAMNLIKEALRFLINDTEKFNYLFLKAECLINSNELSDITPEFASMLNSENDPERLMRIYYILGKTKYLLGAAGYKEAAGLFEKALQIANETDNNTLCSEIMRLLGNILNDSGEFEKALYYKNKSIERSKDVFTKISAYSGLCGLYTAQGKYKEAYLCLEDMNKYYTLYTLSPVKRVLLKSQAAFYYECADYSNCIKVYNELIDLETRMGFMNYMWFNYLLRGLAYYYINELKFARENFEIAEEQIKTSNTRSHLPVNQARTLSFLKEDAVTNKAYIELHLNNINSYYIKNKIIPGKAQVAFYFTALYLKNGEVQSALKYLDDAFKLSSERHMLSFFEREIFMFRHVFDLALSRNLFKPFIGQIYDAVKEKQSFHWLSPEFHKRLKSDIEKLTDLKLLSFGNMELYLRGEVIPEDKWIRKKSKIILAYLLANEGIVLTKDKAIDMFFPELAMDKAEVALHSTVYNIRTAVKIYDIPKEKSKKNTGGSKEFRLQPAVYYL